MSVQIEYEAAAELDIDYKEIITRTVEASLEFEDCPYETMVNVILTDNQEICRINMDYRGIDKPTDVLSFPMIEYQVPGDFSIIEELAPEDCFDPDSGELILGDIILSVDKIIEQAGLYGHSLERELGFLTAHSMLHLFGYDHMLDAERLLMEEKQRAIMQITGLKR